MSVVAISVSSPQGESRSYRYGNLLFWADEGSVHYADSRTHEEGMLAPMQVRERARAIFRLHAKDIYRSDKRKHIQGAKDMILCAQQAEAQGDPRNPEVAAIQADAKRKKLFSLVGMDVPKTTQLIVPETL